MALIACPECASEISDTSAFCPRCGCPIDGDSKVVVFGSTQQFAMNPTVSVFLNRTPGFGRDWIVCAHSLVHSDDVSQAFEVAVPADLGWLREPQKKTEVGKIYISSNRERTDGQSAAFEPRR